MGSVQHGLPRRQPQPQITARRCQTDRENLGSWHALVTLHKRRHRAQLYPGKDKCGERNCLISKTTEKCVRVRAGNGGWKHRDSTERLAEGPGRPAGVASNNRDGAVSGPSEGGAVSLAPTRMSPFDKSKDGLCFPKTGSCVLCLVLRRHSNYCVTWMSPSAFHRLHPCLPVSFWKGEVLVSAAWFFPGTAGVPLVQRCAYPREKESDSIASYIFIPSLVTYSRNGKFLISEGSGPQVAAVPLIPREL